MTPAVARRTVLSVPVAAALSLVLVGQTVAASWSAPTALTSSGTAFAEAIATVGNSTALALYIEHTPDMPDVGYSYRLKIRRSTDSGVTWAPPMTLAENGLNADIASRGSAVDVVWDGINANPIKYRRSLDGGLTFGAVKVISPLNKSARNPSVARGPDGVVAISWENLNTGVLWVRVSIDGGDSWGPPMPLADVAYDMGSEVAVGNGAMYVAYVEDNGFDNLRVKRSTDDGATWSPPIAVTDDAYAVFEQFDITAAGSHAYIGYTIENAAGGEDVRYRRTTDGGVSWSSEANLAPRKWRTWEPAVALRGGVVRAVFTRRTSHGVSVYYRQSSDGINWSLSEKAADVGYEASVGFAGKVIVLYRIGTGDAFVVTGTP